ncbi:hypothetical protein BC828DRAFT_292686 [Blastocladiella britannica]|nr:hypothetical protein BC828DRAFT_292686 [Blastocladiella britannica]
MDWKSLLINKILIMAGHAIRHLDELSAAQRDRLRHEPALAPLMLADTWTALLRDEIRLDTDPRTVASLCECAIAQSPAFEVYHLYCKLIHDNVSEYLEVLAEAPEEAINHTPIYAWPDGCMAILASALDAQGAHFVRGHELFELFMDLHDKFGSPPEVIRQLYLERLAVPCQALTDTFGQYTAFESRLASTSKSLASHFESHLATANAIYQPTLTTATEWAQQYERPLLSPDPSTSTATTLAATVAAYLSEVISTYARAPAIRGFLERTVGEFVGAAAGIATVAQFAESQWTQYISWAASPSSLPGGDGAALAALVAARSTVACPTSARLHVARMRRALHLAAAADVVAVVADAMDAMATATVSDDTTAALDAINQVATDGVRWVARIDPTAARDAVAAVLAVRAATLQRLGMAPAVDDDSVDHDAAQLAGPDPTYALESAVVQACAGVSFASDAPVSGQQQQLCASVEWAVARLLGGCAAARPWSKVIRAIADAPTFPLALSSTDSATTAVATAPIAVQQPQRHGHAAATAAAESAVRVRELYRAASERVADDPRALLADWLEWETAWGSVNDIEALVDRIGALNAYYADYYQAQAAAATAASTSTAVDTADAMVVSNDSVAPASRPATKRRREPSASQAKRDAERAARRTGGAVVPETADDDNEEDYEQQPAAKRAKSSSSSSEPPAKPLPPKMTAEQQQEKLNRTVVIKHVLPSNELALRTLLSACGEIKDLRFLPQPDPTTTPTQVFVQFRDVESILQAFRMRRELKLAASVKPLPMEMAAGATLDPLAVLHAEMEAAKAAAVRDKEVKHAVYAAADREGRSVYVANLGKGIDADAVRAAFNSNAEEEGGELVEDVRLMVTKLGEHKGFGYVTMRDAEAARAAVNRWHGRHLPGAEGRKLVVAISDPSKRKNRGTDGAAPMAASSGNAPPVVRGTRVRDYDPRVVFVRNIGFKTTQVALRAALEQPGGPLLDLRMPKDDAGKPRGVAFATYDSADAAAAAVTAINGTTLDGRVLHLSIAQPTAGGTLIPTPSTPESTLDPTTVTAHPRLARDQQERTAAARQRVVDDAVQAASRAKRAEADKMGARAKRRVLVTGIPTDAKVSAWGDGAAGITHVSAGNAADGARILTFETEPLAATAALALNGTVVDGYTVAARVLVERSDPDAPGPSSAAVGLPPLRGSGVTGGGRPKRRVVVVAPASASGNGSGSAPQQQQPKSNDAFRELFMQSRGGADVAAAAHGKALPQ